jgi:hypothetical protein
MVHLDADTCVVVPECEHVIPAGSVRFVRLAATVKRHTTPDATITRDDVLVRNFENLQPASRTPFEVRAGKVATEARRRTA